MAKSTQSGIKKQLTVIEKQIASMTSAADEIGVLQGKLIEMKDRYSNVLLESTDTVLESTKEFDGKLNLHLESVGKQVELLKNNDAVNNNGKDQTQSLKDGLKTDEDIPLKTDSNLETKKKKASFW